MGIWLRPLLRSILSGAGMVIVLALTAAAILSAQTGDQKEHSAPANGAKEKDQIEVHAWILSIDAIKGDVTARLEFTPHGSYAKEDGTLAKTIKFDTYSANGKQELTFEKGKRMPPTEVVLSMYEGEVSDYPFDRHKAQLTIWFTVKPDKPAEKPKSTEETHDVETKTAPVEEQTEVEVPLAFDFSPKLAGYTIEATKNKDSDGTFADFEMSIARSGMVKFFSIFVMILMWGVSIAVLGLVLSVVVRGRKVEIAMFSFIATLLFAFVAVRNAQPAVPPIGTFSDYTSFLWAEVILALSLLTIVFTWLMRPAAK